MSKQSFLYGVALLLLLSSSYGLRAQDASDIQVNFRALAWSKPIRDLYFVQGGQPVPVRMSNRAVSQVYSYRGQSPLRFYKNKQTAEGETVPVEVGQVSFSNGSHKPLLVFLPNGDANYRIISLADEKLYQLGSCFLYNVSGKNLAFKVGGEQMLMKPQMFQRIDLQEIAKTEPVKDSVSVAIASQDDQDAWDVVYKQRWPILENSSFLVFAINQEGHIRVRLIPIPIG